MHSQSKCGVTQEDFDWQQQQQQQQQALGLQGCLYCCGPWPKALSWQLSEFATYCHWHQLQLAAAAATFLDTAPMFLLKSPHVS
jgi:hypothetical protein